MKYENIEKVNILIKQIKKDEKELEELSSYKSKPMKIVICNSDKTILTIGIGDIEHTYTKQATAFIDDCIQIIRDKITKSKKELESL